MPTGVRSRSDACPLCGGAAAPWFVDGTRDYLRCGHCGFVHVPAAQRLSRQAERDYYLTHRNETGDPGYRAWLSRLAVPLLERLPPHARGLDFGCGPAPALAAMLAEAGMEVALYDPQFAPDTSVFAQEWDFITATEVLEHLHRPAAELERLWSLLRPGGWLAVMTRRVPALAEFEHWHYRRDPTHIGFFAAQSFAWLAGRWGAELELRHDDVALLGKPGRA
jgi:SAM-dependent methyltransferase